MSITILGPDRWPTVQTLRNAVEALAGDLRISWGVQAPDAINGMPRLNATQQLTALAGENIAVPDWTIDRDLAMEWVRGGATVFGRKLRHTQGLDIQLPGRLAPTTWRWKWMRSDWWSKVVPITDEWRFHVWKGMIIARAKKVQTESPSRIAPVRSRRNGWTMVHNEEPPNGMRPIAKAAVAAVGYDFGAVDMGVLEDGKFVVFEVNSAPALRSPYTLGAYLKAIEREVVNAGTN